MPNPFQNIWGTGEVGEGTKLAAFVDIGGKVGKNCSIQTFVSIPPGITIEDYVFIGPRVSFANDQNPTTHGEWRMKHTLVKRNAMIGIGVIVGPGVTIGERAFIKAGAIIKHDVPDDQVVQVGEIW